MTTSHKSTPEERAAQRAEDYYGLMWHVASYIIINVFLWFIVPQAAFWVTLGWGFGLAFHLAYYFIGDTGPDSRRYRKYLAEERAKDQESQSI